MLTANKDTETDKITKHSGTNAIITEELLKDLYHNKNFSAEEIAAQLHCARGTIYRYLQKFNLYKRAPYKTTPTVHIDAALRKSILESLINGRSIADTAKTHAIAAADVRVVLKDEFALQYVHLESLLTLSKIYHCDRRTIRKYLAEKGFTYIEHNIEKVQRHRTKEYDRPLSSHLEEIIIGELLGDGHIRNKSLKNNNMASPSVEEYRQACNFLQKSKEIQELNYDSMNEIIQAFNKSVYTIANYPTAFFWLHVSILEGHWIDCISKIFKNNNYPTHILTQKEKSNAGQKRWNISLRSKSSVQLTKLHEKWYIAETGKKIIPRDLKLTPNILLHWFIGDGSRTRSGLKLATDGFSKDDVIFLQEKLEEELKIHFSIIESKYEGFKTHDYWILNISSKENIEKFYSYLEKADKTALECAKENFPWKFAIIAPDDKEKLLETRKNSDKFIALYLDQEKNSNNNIE